MPTEAGDGDDDNKDAAAADDDDDDDELSRWCFDTNHHWMSISQRKLSATAFMNHVVCV